MINYHPHRRSHHRHPVQVLCFLVRARCVSNIICTCRPPFPLFLLQLRPRYRCTPFPFGDELIFALEFKALRRMVTILEF